MLSTDKGNSYNPLWTNTSFATPHGTGVAALLKAQDPTRDWKQIKNLILAGGAPNSSLASITITGKRLNAHGSLACSNSVVLSRLRPIPNATTAAVGTPLLLSVLHINCDTPNGPLEVTVSPGGQSITLQDDGAGPDQEAGDGIYSAAWVPASVGRFTLTFPANDVVPVQVLTPYTQSSTTFGYRTFRKGKNLNLGGDDARVVTSPFPIRFGGGSFTQLFVQSNGTINFDDLFGSPANDALPTSPPANLIAPFWDDLIPIQDTRKNVLRKVLGTAPNRELVIEWRNLRHVACANDKTATVRFQVVFFEGSSDILFNYWDTTFGGACPFADQGGSATVGVQVAPNVATQLSFDTPSLTNETAILWRLSSSPPGPTLSASQNPSRRR